VADERPRPQYGEYATPEEQVLAGGIAVPPRDQSPVQESSTSARSTTAHAKDSLSLPKPEASIGGAASSGINAQLARERRPLDTFVTTFVLSLSAFLVISTSGSWADLPGSLIATYKQLGYGEFTSIEFASTMGTVIAVVQSVLLIGAALVSILRLRAKRSSWWVPVVFGLASILLTIVLMAIVMMTDPALAAYIATQQ